MRPQPFRDGSSLVGVDGSMRARDVSRPTAEEKDKAERDVQVVVRRSSNPSGRGGTTPERS